MAVVAGRLTFRLTYNNLFSRVNSLSLLLLNSPRCVEPVCCIQQRWVNYAFPKREVSPFPKEDGVTRLQEEDRKNNSPDERYIDKQVPNDHGFKPDSTGQIFSHYIPKAKKSPRDVWEATKANFRRIASIALIKRKDKNNPFKSKEFARLAQKKFIDLNNDLQLKNSKSVDLRMKENTTLLVLKALKAQFENPGKTIYWRFVKELKQPKVVNVQVVHVGDKHNLYAQVTVKMFTEQILAIRDRYDRLLTGSLKNPRKVTDYVVFERHVADAYGKWRICGKINE